MRARSPRCARLSLRPTQFTLRYLMATLKAGERFPSFTLMGIDSATYSLTAAGAEPTLLTFFKNTCPTCMLILPYLQRLYERVEGAPLHFWGISQDSAEQTRLFGEQ